MAGPFIISYLECSAGSAPASACAPTDASRLPSALQIRIVRRMRRASSLILAVLLVLGSALSGQGHVHATPKDERSGGLHVDHVHVGSDHDSHDTDRASDPGLAPEHSGDDAVILSLAGAEAMPKRALPCLAASVFAGGSPMTPAYDAHDRPEEPPRIPPVLTRPPGRAPPA